jgi:hypothetical protein
MSSAVKAVVAVIVIAILVIGGFVIFNKKSSPATKPVSTTLSSTASSASFTIKANDAGADHETIAVGKGTKVNLKFDVDEKGVYHGGLDFKSTDPAVDSGPIDTGESKSVSFTADKSFSFTPYWYRSGVKKDYVIAVQVN